MGAQEGTQFREALSPKAPNSLQPAYPNEPVDVPLAVPFDSPAEALQLKVMKNTSPSSQTL